MDNTFVQHFQFVSALRGLHVYKKPQKTEDL